MIVINKSYKFQINTFKFSFIRTQKLKKKHHNEENQDYEKNFNFENQIKFQR